MPSIELSFIFASNKPKKLAEFYSFALQAEIQRGISKDHWFISNPHGIKIQFYLPSRNRQTLTALNSMGLCLQGAASADPLVAIEQWSELLASKGALSTERARLESFGAESWMKDPEGNAFLLLIPNLQNNF